LSYHKFNESQREQAVLKRLQQGEIVAQICDVGTPGISDPGMELALRVRSSGIVDKGLTWMNNWTKDRFDNDKWTKGRFGINEWTEGRSDIYEWAEGRFDMKEWAEGHFDMDEWAEGRFDMKEWAKGRFDINERAEGHLDRNEWAEGRFDISEWAEGRFDISEWAEGRFSMNGNPNGPKARMFRTTVKLCVDENIPVIPIPGPFAFVAALSASGLATDEFTFVGFLPKHAGLRKERLIVSANEVATQIFYVLPHKLHQFIEEASSIFGGCRQCAIAREMTKIHEQFWCGTLEEAKGAFLTRQPKGEITFLIEGKANCVVEAPSVSQLENELRELISGGQCLSSGKMDAAASMIEKAIVANPTYAKAFTTKQQQSHFALLAMCVMFFIFNSAGLLLVCWSVAAEFCWAAAAAMLL
ncbi:hypothetical protein HYC85_010433, partial [Camellia sinensis]